MLRDESDGFGGWIVIRPDVVDIPLPIPDFTGVEERGGQRLNEVLFDESVAELGDGEEWTEAEAEGSGFAFAWVESEGRFSVLIRDRSGYLMGSGLLE